MSCPAHLPLWVHACFTLLLAIEYWLGKTERLKASSILELIAVGVMIALTAVHIIHGKKETLS